MVDKPEKRMFERHFFSTKKSYLDNNQALATQIYHSAGVTRRVNSPPLFIIQLGVKTMQFYYPIRG